MNEIRRTYPRRTVTWRCGCGPYGTVNTLAEKTCPHCGKPMPQSVRDIIYEEVSEELRIKCRQDRQRRWRKFGDFCLEKWPLTLLMLLIIFFAVLWIVFPYTFWGIVDDVGGAIFDTVEFVSNTADTVGRFFQGLGRVLGGVGRFLMTLLKGLWWLLGILWDIVCWIAGLVWDLLVLLFENMPEILGWLWRALQWLWKALVFLLGGLWDLIKFIWGALPAIFSFLWDACLFLLQVIGGVLGILWSIIKAIFSWIF